jgi:hypothetical protein
MFDVDSLIEELTMEMSMVSSGIDNYTIDTLMKNYVVPSFNRDYPNIQSVIIMNTTRFYPYLDLTTPQAGNFLNHIFLIEQQAPMFMWLQSQLGEGEGDNFTLMASTDIIQKILRFSYKENSFVSSPVIIYDDTQDAYYYALNAFSRYILIYSLMNNVDSTRMMSPQDYEALKWYAGWKITEFVITGMDMSTVGVVNEYLAKIMQGISATDVSTLFNPGVTSLSFGGEISIGFNPLGSLTQAVHQAVPLIRSAYKDVQDSLRRYHQSCFKRFKNKLMMRFMWLYLV